MTRAEAIELLARREQRTPESYVGVLNEYLQKRLGLAERVVGEVEVLRACECCGFRTIAVELLCPVCFWEQGGGGENRLTLEQARSNYESIGAVDEWSVDAVLIDGPKRYAK